MKKTKILAILMAATMLASCGKAPVEETTEETGKERETTTTTTTEETTTTEATPTPTPEPTTAATTEPTSAEIAGDRYNDDEDQYSIIKDKVDSIEAEFPGSSYAIVIRPGGYLMLIASTGEDMHFYVIDDDEMVETESDIELEGVAMSSYEGIVSMPYLVPGYARGELVTSLEDGIYYGELIALSEDGTSIYVYAGNAVTFDRAYIESLSEGDQVTYICNGVECVSTISEISEYTDDDGVVHESYWLDNAELWISDDYEGDPDTMMLMSASYNPCREYNYTVVLPIASSCEVTDTFDRLYGDIDMSDMVPTGNPIFDSRYWYVISSNESRDDLEDGWYRECCYLLYPIEIRNGEVVRLNVEWR